MKPCSNVWISNCFYRLNKSLLLSLLMLGTPCNRRESMCSSRWRGWEKSSNRSMKLSSVALEWSWRNELKMRGHVLKKHWKERKRSWSRSRPRWTKMTVREWRCASASIICEFYSFSHCWKGCGFGSFSKHVHVCPSGPQVLSERQNLADQLQRASEDTELTGLFQKQNEEQLQKAQQRWPLHSANSLLFFLSSRPISIFKFALSYMFKCFPKWLKEMLFTVTIPFLRCRL